MPVTRRFFVKRSRRAVAALGVAALAAVSAGTAACAQAVQANQLATTASTSGWKRIFTENFTTNAATGSFPGSAYGSRWSGYPDGWRDTTRVGVYWPSKVLSVHDGVLDYKLQTVSGTPLVAAPIPKLPGAGPGGGLTYARYSVRFRADPITGYKVAWLLWPDSGRWPADGEIDFPEGSLNANMSAFAHFANPAGGQHAFTLKTTFTSWHTAVIEWTPGRLRFFLDGTLVGTSTQQVPTKPMHWVLQAETDTNGVRPAASAVGHIYVDWVTVDVPS